MCKRITCLNCEKETWSGCGCHIDQALAGLKEEEICKCKKDLTETQIANIANAEANKAAA